MLNNNENIYPVQMISVHSLCTGVKVYHVIYLLLFIGCDATVDVSTTDLFTPGYTIGQTYPDLLSCEFIIRSENVEQPLSILFNDNFQIKAKDSLTVCIFN